jgi:hypothetical protein
MFMATTVNERISNLIEKLARNKQKDFAESIGVPPPTINGIIGKRQTEPGYAILNKILEKYPNVNSDWLMKGEGEMLKDTASSLPNKSQDGGAYGREVEGLMEENRWLKNNLDRALRMLELKLGKIKGVVALRAALGKRIYNRSFSLE